MRSSKKTLIILGLLSFISLIAFMSLLLGSDESYSYRKYLLAYIYAPIACVYLLLAMWTYIFKKIKENRKRSQELKKYFNPIFVILTFILFNTFPISLVLLHDFDFPNKNGYFGDYYCGVRSDDRPSNLHFYFKTSHEKNPT